MNVPDGVMDSTARVILLSADKLMQDNPIAFYELVEKCRDDGHRFFGNAGEVLRERNLVEANGQPHQVTRDVILANTRGDGLDLTLDLL